MFSNVLSGDQSRILTSRRSQLVILDSQSGEQLHAVNIPTDASEPFREEQHQWLRHCLSHDGKLAFTVSRAKLLGVNRLHQIDIQTGVSSLLTEVDWSTTERMISDNGGRLIAMVGYRGEAGTAAIFDINSQQIVELSLTNLSAITAVAFSRDDTKLALGDDKGAVSVWSISDLRELAHWHRHSTLVHCIAFDASGQRLATGSLDSLVKVSQLPSGEELRSYKSHLRPLRLVAFSPDDRQLASASIDGFVKLWDLDKPSDVPAYNDHTSAVHVMDVSSDGRWVASGDGRGNIRIWNPMTMETVTVIPASRDGHTAGIVSVDFLLGDEQLVSVSWDQSTRLWDVATGTMVSNMTGPHRRGLKAGALSPCGKFAASAGFDKTIAVWDIRQGKAAHLLRNPIPSVYGVRFSPDGRRFVAVGGGVNDQNIAVWNRAQMDQAPDTIPNPGAKGSCIAFSPDSRYFAIGSVSSHVQVYETETLTEIAVLVGHVGRVTSVAFSPTEPRLVSASDDRTIKIWDTSTWTEAMTLRGHSDDIKCVTFSPDGHRIFSGGKDKKIRIWDARPMEQ